MLAPREAFTCSQTHAPAWRMSSTRCVVVACVFAAAAQTAAATAAAGEQAVSLTTAADSSVNAWWLARYLAQANDSASASALHGGYVGEDVTCTVAPSKDPKIGVADSIKPVENYKSSQNNYYSNTNGSHRNGFKHVELKSSEDPYLKKQNNKPDEKKAPLAFVIQFDENKKTGPMHRPPPGRLQLEPLRHVPNLTQEKLDEKMKIVERNREQILAKRVKSSKSSKKRNNIQRQRDDESDYSKENSNLERKQNFYERMPNEIRSNDRRSSEEDSKRERLLKARRIIPNPSHYDYDDDDIEHDKNYNRYSNNEDDF